MNESITVSTAIDELAIAKERVAVLEGFLKSETARGSFEQETNTRFRALGNLFQAVISIIPAGKTVDYKAILAAVCEKHSIRVSPQMLAAHTRETSGYTRMTISARKDEVARSVA